MYSLCNFINVTYGPDGFSYLELEEKDYIFYYVAKIIIFTYYTRTLKTKFPLKCKCFINTTKVL